MEQNTNNGHSGISKHKSRGSRRRKSFIIVLLVALVIITSIAVWAIKSPLKTSANVEKNNNSVFESQTEQTIASTEQTEKNESNNEEAVIETEFDYSKPVPKSEIVENSYFDDAVFIGDSRTEGFILYTGLTNAISYTNKGLTVDTVFTKPVINKNGDKISVMDALRQTDFSKVYIMLGINETGWPYNNIFIEKYEKIIDEIKAINPDATIYVEEILPVTDKVSQTHSYVKNEKIKEYNALIRQMAEEKKIYYIDTGKAVADTNGSLPENAAIDGIHLKKSYCEKWLEYLKTHTVTNIER